MAEDCSVSVTHPNRVRANNRGGTARLTGYALLSNPYARNTTLWDDWRDGWLSEDLNLHNKERERLAVSEELTSIVLAIALWWGLPIAATALISVYLMKGSKS